MTNDQESNRRRFMRTALTAAGVLASPWCLQSARASETGRAVIGFQLPPDGMLLLNEVMKEIRTRYHPDLGAKPVVIPGAAGGMAIDAVAASAPDGGTALIAPSTMLSLAPIVWKTAADPADTLIPVAGIGDLTLTFSVGPAVPDQVRTMADYIRWVRENPRGNGYGVPGLGTATHYVGAEVARLGDVSLRVIGYKGVSGVVEDLAAGRIPAGITPPIGPNDMARFPFRVLAVTGEQRLSYLRDVPTLRESGFAEATPTETLGLFLPRGTPDEKVRELATAVSGAIGSPSVKAAMIATGMLPITVSGDSYAKVLMKERTDWKTLVARHEFTAGR